jgi:bifunctional non-homologous end joining protein LigD
MSSRILPAGFIEPCQPVGAAKPPAGPSWLHEIKYDGYRLMAQRRGVGGRLLTRNGNDWTERYPSVVAALYALKVKSCLIDGEITVCDNKGPAVFDLLRHGSRIKPEAVLFAFDLLELDGEGLRSTPIEMRKRKLAQLLRHVGSGLHLSDHLHGHGTEIFEHACRLGCEGIVSKRLGSRYVSGRTSHWIKVKNPAAPAVKREAEEDWGPNHRRMVGSHRTLSGLELRTSIADYDCPCAAQHQPLERRIGMPCRPQRDSQLRHRDVAGAQAQVH